MFCIASSGFLAEVVAASTLVADSGIQTLAIVWPIGGLISLALALIQVRFVDRLARIPVITTITFVLAALLGIALINLGVTGSTFASAALASIVADQLNFLLPLIVWSLAGDIFTAGQTISIFPRLVRWTLWGQIAGLGMATVTPILARWWEISATWALVVPVFLLVLSAFFIQRNLKDASSSEGHGRTESATESIKAAWNLVNSLPAYRYIFWTSLVVITAGTVIEFDFLFDLEAQVKDSYDIHLIFAATAFIGFLLRVVLGSFRFTDVLRKVGPAKALTVLPIATVAASFIAFASSFVDAWLLMALGVITWRYFRWGVDLSARQSAMAGLPDERRSSVVLITDLLPQAIALIVAPLSLVFSRVVDMNWLVSLISGFFAIVGVIVSRRIFSSWEETQLSYRLKRRKRIT